MTRMTREEAEKYIKSKMCSDCGVHLGGGKCLDNCSVIEAIKALEQEPKTGHWIVDRETFRVNLRGKQEFSYSTHCDKCNYHWDFTTDKKYSKPSNYCPRCGCCMVESQESEEV